MGFFFFQAEDGIRDLVRSRGLGDVYKRQVEDVHQRALAGPVFAQQGQNFAAPQRQVDLIVGPVSYTHLTLPTSDLV